MCQRLINLIHKRTSRMAELIPRAFEEQKFIYSWAKTS